MENNSSLNQQIPQQTPQNTKKKTSYIWIAIFFVLIIFMSVVFVFIRVHNNSTHQTNQTQITPTIKETDMSPGIPNNQKTAVVIMHSDSSMEKILMANTLVDSYVKNLDADTKVVSETPLK